MRQRRLPVEQVDLQKREIDLECENTCLRMERDIPQTSGDIQRSIRRVCNCYDNAIQQSFWNILKRKAINGRQLRTITERQRWCSITSTCFTIAKRGILR